MCSRKILGLRQDARSYMLHHLMDSTSIESIIKKRILTFFISGLNHDSEIISNFFKNTLISNSSTMLTNINYILNDLGINYNKLFSLSKQDISVIIKHYDGVPDFRCKTVKELLITKELQSFNFLNIRQVNDILTYMSTYS